MKFFDHCEPFGLNASLYRSLHEHMAFVGKKKRKKNSLRREFVSIQFKIFQPKNYDLGNLGIQSEPITFIAILQSKFCIGYSKIIQAKYECKNTYFNLNINS